jgi:hypothetical protein
MTTRRQRDSLAALGTQDGFGLFVKPAAFDPARFNRLT